MPGAPNSLNPPLPCTHTVEMWHDYKTIYKGLNCLGAVIFICALTLWLCCSWNKLLICLAGGELAPRLSLVSPKVFSPFCHRWSFGSLPLSPLACSVGDTSFPAQSSTWLHRYYLNWTKLDNAITKFNNEMHSADNWVLNPVILHYWQICLFWYCAVLCYNLYC